MPSPLPVLPGVIVENLEAGGEGSKAGMQQGDILLTWSRGDASGKIESPFDMVDLEFEQKARGNSHIIGSSRKGKTGLAMFNSSWCGVFTCPKMPRLPLPV